MNLKFGVKNILMVGLMATLFIIVVKVLVTKYNVPGISTVMAAV